MLLLLLYRYLLILGSTTPYCGTQIVTLVMPLRYPQPILFLDIRHLYLRISHYTPLPFSFASMPPWIGTPSVGFLQEQRISTYAFYIFASHITHLFPSLLHQCRHGLGLHRLGFCKSRGSRHTPSTSSHLTLHTSLSARAKPRGWAPLRLRSDQREELLVTSLLRLVQYTATHQQFLIYFVRTTTSEQKKNPKKTRKNERR